MLSLNGLSEAKLKRKLPAEYLELLREQGRRGGKLEWCCSHKEKLTPEQRTAIAKKAVAAREAKRRIRRYALLLPPPIELHARICALEAELNNYAEAHRFKQVVMEGRDPGEVAALWRMSEPELMHGIQEIIRKLNQVAD